MTRRPVAVTSFAVWTPEGRWFDTPPLEVDHRLGGGDTQRGRRLSAWPDAPPLQQLHPRARRPHPHAVQWVQLASELLRRRESRDDLPGIQRTEVDALLGTQSASEGPDVDFLQSMKQRGEALGSPSLFVYTLATAAAAEVSLALGLKGALRTVSAGGASGMVALAQAASHVSAGRSRACLCGVANFHASSLPGDELLALFLLEPTTDVPPSVSRVTGWAYGFEPFSGAEAREARPQDALHVPALVTLAQHLGRRRPDSDSNELGDTSSEGHWATVRVG